MASKSVMAALSRSFSEPRFSWRGGESNASELRPPLVDSGRARLQLCPHLDAADLFADQEADLLPISRRVVNPAPRRKPVSSGTARFLVVTRQGLGQVPVGYKPIQSHLPLLPLLFIFFSFSIQTSIQSIKASLTNDYSTTSRSPPFSHCEPIRVCGRDPPDVGLVDAHPKADGGHDHSHSALHPAVLHLRTVTRLESWPRKNVLAQKLISS